MIDQLQKVLIKKSDEFWLTLPHFTIIQQPKHPSPPNRLPLKLFEFPASAASQTRQRMTHALYTSKSNFWARFRAADVYIRVCALACGPYSNTLCLFPFDPTRAGFEPLNVEFDTRHTQRNKLSVVRTCRRSGNAYCGHHDAAFGKFSMFDVLNNRLGFGIFCLKKILIRNFCRRWNLSKLSANIYALLFVNY